MKINVKSIFILAVCLVSIMAIFRLTELMFEGEEGRLKRTLHRAKRLAERENILGLTNYISSDYSDELGNDRRTLLFIAKRLFGEYKNILILIDSLDIEILGDNADAFVEATVYWQENNSANITYDRIECKAVFIRAERNWKLLELKFFEPEEKRIFNPNIG